MRLILPLLLLWPASAWAGPMCLSSLPGGTLTIESDLHLQVAVWEDANASAGDPCPASSHQARPTAGPYERFFGDGLHNWVTFTEARFNPYCVSQADVRAVNDAGEIVAYYDFTVRFDSYDPVQCFPPAAPPPVFDAPTSWVPVITPVTPTVPPVTPPIVPPVTPPSHPVPDSGSTLVLCALVALAAAVGRGTK